MLGCPGLTRLIQLGAPQPVAQRNHRAQGGLPRVPRHVLESAAATTLAGLATAALISAVIPAAAGLAFLIALYGRRPLISVAARRWPWLTGRPAHRATQCAPTRLTTAWGTGMPAAAAVQGAGAITGALGFGTLASFTARH